MGRDWSAFIEKVHTEGKCRVCRVRAGEAKIDAAHIIPRSRISGPGADFEANCCPLCRDCHTEYDMGRLDLLPYLTPLEQAMAVTLCGSILEALRRVSGPGLESRYAVPERPAAGLHSRQGS